MDKKYEFQWNEKQNNKKLNIKKLLFFHALNRTYFEDE